MSLHMNDLWPSNTSSKGSERIACTSGSRVLFPMRSIGVREDYTDPIVGLKTLDLDRHQERNTAVCVLKERHNLQRDNP